MKTIKIINGLVPDFKNRKFVQKDIFIEEVWCYRVFTKSADITIEAKNRIVSPGFIDIHMHEEVIDINEPDPYFTAYYELQMGVTTCAAGNCGNNRQSIETFKGYIDQNFSPVNYLTFIGHNYLRNQVGVEDRYRASTKNEIEKMKAIIEKYKTYGIIGISYGIEYSPGIETQEIIDLASALDSEHYLLSAHFREDGEKSVESIKELIQVAKETKLPMQISHIGSCSAYGYMTQSLKEIEKSRKEGYSIFADCYPYDAFATFIGSAVFDEGCFERWNKTYHDILLTEAPYRNTRCTEELFYKVRKEYPNMIVAAFVMNEHEVVEAIQSPFVYVGSDSLFKKDSGHPRGAGSFPRVLSKYVREEQSLELIDALWKMTLGPAERLRLSNKGQIEVGMDADITIFDQERIKDSADYANPTAPPEGIDYVIVNGEMAVQDKKIVNGRLGKYVKYQLN